MYVTVGSGILNVNGSGTDVVLTRFPDAGKDLNAFGLDPSAIKSIAIPNDLQEWPTTALNGCTNLTALTVFGPEAGEGDINLSPSHNLSLLENLTSIQLPSTVRTVIGDEARAFPAGLKSIHFPQKLREIGIRAFNHCTSLGSVNLPNKTHLEKIENFAFSYCAGLRFLDLQGCTSLRTIGQDGFARCSNLTFVDLSSCTGLTTLMSGAFHYDTRLAGIILPASLITVEYKAFWNCALETVYWGGSDKAENTDANAFADCPSSLQHVFNFVP